jgi:hypothetical protein
VLEEAFLVDTCSPLHLARDVSRQLARGVVLPPVAQAPRQESKFFAVGWREYEVTRMTADNAERINELA